MGGGIIINRSKALLVAATDPSIYEALSAAQKAAVDAIDAAEPASRTQTDINLLLVILNDTCGC